MKSAASMSNNSKEKKYYYLKNFFGGVKKQKITEKRTTADGMKVNKIIETQIPCADSATF